MFRFAVRNISKVSGHENHHSLQFPNQNLKYAIDFGFPLSFTKPKS